MCVQRYDDRTQDGRGLMAVEESESIWHREVPNLSRALDTIVVERLNFNWRCRVIRQR